MKKVEIGDKTCYIEIHRGKSPDFYGTLSIEDKEFDMTTWGPEKEVEMLLKRMVKRYQDAVKSTNDVDFDNWVKLTFLNKNNRGRIDPQ